MEGGEAAPREHLEWSAGATEFGSRVARDWFHTNVAVAEECLSSRFVHHLCACTMPQAVFESYAAQDAIYLQRFKEVYEVAASRAGCSTSLGPQLRDRLHQYFLSEVDGVRREMDTIYKAVHVEAATGATSTPAGVTDATANYTAFLADTAERSILEICASLLPCSRLYAFLAQRILSGLRFRAPPHLGQVPPTSEREALGSVPCFFREWLRKYSSAEYELSVRKLEAVLAELHEAEESEAARHRAQELYDDAMLLELEFFAAFDNMLPLAPCYLPLDRFVPILASDFDGTITTQDTSRCIPELRAQKFSSEGIAERWSNMEKNYESKFEAFLNTALDKGEQSVELQEFFDAMDSFEMDMIEPVVAGGHLAGVTREEVEAESKKWGKYIRPGWPEVFRNVVRSGGEVCVVSANFSRSFVRSCVGVDPPPVRDYDVCVMANELEWDLFGESNGQLKIQTSCGGQKATAVRKWREKVSREIRDREQVLIYVGDSLNDLPAALQAQYGIIMEKDLKLHVSRSLARACQKLGVELCPLHAARKPVSNRLYYASSWHGVSRWLRQAFSGAVGYAPARVLVCAGSDSGGGAGIQADIKACDANGAFACTVITAVTAQNSSGLCGSPTLVSSEMIERQMRCVLRDFGTSVVKTGMLANEEVIATIANVLSDKRLCRSMMRRRIPLVLDPVMVATSGHALVSENTARALRKRLFPLSTIVTPNIPEAKKLASWEREVRSVEDMTELCRAIALSGARWVLVKGGHLTAPDLRQVPNVLYDARLDEVTVYRCPRVATGNTHGTGCTLASTIAALMAKGHSVPMAVGAAVQYVHECLSASTRLRLGSDRYGPMQHARCTNFACSHGWDLRVYAVTHPGMAEDLELAVLAAIRGGATVVQYRNKAADSGVAVSEALPIRKLCAENGVSFVVNDRLDVAMAVRADGVHLGQTDLPLTCARRIVGHSMVIGISVRTVEEARRAEQDSADYVGAGAVFPTGTKEDSDPLGLAVLREICRSVSIPVVAIGGIDTGNTASVIRCGCAGVAAVSAVFGQADIRAGTAALRDVVAKEMASRYSSA